MRMTSRSHPVPAVHLAPPQATRGAAAETVRRHTEMRAQWATEALAYVEGLRRDLDVLMRALPSGSSGDEGAGQRRAV